MMMVFAVALLGGAGQHGNMISPLNMIHLAHVLAPFTHCLVVLIRVDQKLLLLLLRVQIKLGIPLACLCLNSCVIVVPKFMLKRALVQDKLASVMLPQDPIRHGIHLVLTDLFQDIPGQLRILIVKLLLLSVLEQPAQVLKG